MKNKNNISVSPDIPRNAKFDRKINLQEVENLTSDNEGKVLTIIDASISEPKQREAIKSLIRQALWSNYQVVSRWFFDQDFEKGKGTFFPYGIKLPLEQSSI